MNFIDLKSQYSGIKNDINQRIQAVLDHGRYINGPEVTELESSLANYIGVKHVIGVSKWNRCVDYFVNGTGDWGW